MHEFSIHQAKTQFSELIKQVLKGEEIIISKGKKPIAKIVAIDEKKPQRKLGTAKGKIKISADFD